MTTRRELARRGPVQQAPTVRSPRKSLLSRSSLLVGLTLFLGACIVGWRAVYRLIDQRRNTAVPRGSVLSK